MASGKRMNPFQHALKRPANYIGSVTNTEREMWLPKTDEVSTEDGLFEKKCITYNPGLVHVFVELISNAIDNKWRSEQDGIAMKRIDILVGDGNELIEDGWISVTNDGKHIPVEKYQYDYEDYRTGKKITEQLYPAEVFFGEMLAGTNFDNDESRKTSGRNGMGAKASSVYSVESIVDHTDPNTHKRFRQTYSNNGKERTKPEITAYRGKAYTCITYLPDYKYFKYPSAEELGIDENLVLVLKRLCYDAAMITGLLVTFNGEQIKIPNLLKYAKLYYPQLRAGNSQHLVTDFGDECVFVERSLEEAEEDPNLNHISYINGINTHTGGVHVNAFKEALFPVLAKAFNGRRGKSYKTTARDFYPYITLFIRCESTNVDFDSATKEYLTAPSPYPLYENKKDFTEKIDAIVAKMLKWSFIKNLEEKLNQKLNKVPEKKATNRRHIKLADNQRDANLAGTNKSSECILYICEGSSAKAMVERLTPDLPGAQDYNGVMAVRGKVLNVERVNRAAIEKNEELKQLMDMTNLQYGVDYSKPENLRTLRYGKIRYLTDQDEDGFHIQDLLTVFFFLWPELFKLSMIEIMSTAVVMFKKGDKIIPFYSNQDAHIAYEEMSQQEKRGMKVDYKKGLGSHSPEDYGLYVDDPKIVVKVLDKQAVKYMKIASSKEKAIADERKQMIIHALEEDAKGNTVPFTYEGELPISNFVKHHLMIYWKTALRRAIPCMIDNYKEAIRKVYFGINKCHAYKEPLPLSVLVGSIKKHTAYHHAEDSLCKAINGMVQGFVGANNIPLLTLTAEFGTRLEGGKDAAAPRYTKTRLEEIALKIYRPEDEPILEVMYDDNSPIEYKFYVPVVPMILINGNKGIGCGFSCEFAQYNPEDVVDRVKLWLKTGSAIKEDDPLLPWYRGFTGEIEVDLEKKRWTSKGRIAPHPEKKGWYVIDELPIGVWTDTVKAKLSEMKFAGGTKKNPTEKKLLEVYPYNTTNSVRFEIKPVAGYVPSEEEPEFKFLTKTHSLNNMYALDMEGRPKKYESPEEIVDEFCKVRLEYYRKRKEYQVPKMESDLERDENKLKYIKAVVNKKLDLYQEEETLEAAMKKLGLKKMVFGDDEQSPSYEYLFDLKTKIMKKKFLDALESSIEEQKVALAEYKKKTPKRLFLDDLNDFSEAYQKFLTTRTEEISYTRRGKARAKK